MNGDFIRMKKTICAWLYPISLEYHFLLSFSKNRFKVSATHSVQEKQNHTAGVCCTIYRIRMWYSYGGSTRFNFSSAGRYSSAHEQLNQALRISRILCVQSACDFSSSVIFYAYNKSIFFLFGFGEITDKIFYTRCQFRVFLEKCSSTTVKMNFRWRRECWSWMASMSNQIFVLLLLLTSIYFACARHILYKHQQIFRS